MRQIAQAFLASDQFAGLKSQAIADWLRALADGTRSIALSAPNG